MRTKGTRYLDKIELFSTVNTTNEIGKRVASSISLGIRSAYIEVIGVNKIAYYKQIGYQRPVIIKMFDPKLSITSVKWKDKTIHVKSIQCDKNNSLKIVITGDIIEDEDRGT